MRLPVILSAVVALLVCGQVDAKPRFNGSVGYEFVNNGESLAITTGLIDNSVSTAGTGTLQVVLWATTSPYKGGSISGKQLGTYKLTPLKAGQYYRDLRKVVTYRPPSTKGTYFITLTLSEFSNNAFGIVDYRNMPNALTLAPFKAFTMSTCSWQSNPNEGTVALSVGKISHRSKGKTGSLKISIWATDAPYRGGNLVGHSIGYVVKDGLEAGYSYTNLKLTAKYTPPPKGTYSTVWVLSQYNQGKYTIVDYITTHQFATFP